MFTRRIAPERPTTYDPDTRTVELTVSSFADVRRFDLFTGDKYVERLSRDPRDWDFGRIASPAGLPLLADHRQQIESRIGIITAARVTSDGVLAVAQLSQSAEAERTARDLEAGLPIGCSIGYTVGRFEDAGEKIDGLPVRIARKITVHEISLTPLPADAGAATRSMEMKMQNENQLDDATETRTQPREPEPSADITTRTADDDARTRVALAARYGSQLGEQFFLTRSHVPLADLRRELLNELARRDSVDIGHTQISTIDNRDRVADAVRCALALRMGAKLSDGETALGRSYMAEHGASIIDIGAGWLRARGERIGSRHELASRLLMRAGLHSTSDFPALLSNAANKILIDNFQAAQSGLMQLASEMDASDFKPISLVKMGESPKLNEVLEGAEITHGTIAEAKEAMRVRTFARIFGLTRQAIVNDDLGAFSDRVRVIGRGAAQTIGDELVALLSANNWSGVTLDDGQPLFDSAHANDSGASLTVPGLSSARQLMREQRGLDGTTPLNVVPRFLVAGSASETAAEQLLATLYPAQVSDANPFAGRLTLVVEPRISGAPWYLFADPQVMPVIRIAWLNGNRAPIIEQRDGWEVLGVEFRAVLDFGCAIVDYRGVVKGDND